MWYSPEHFIAFSSLFLLTPATLPRDPGAGGAHVTACDASVPRLPPSVQLEPGLEPIVRRTLEHSPTFRRQCRALASAPDIAITVEVAIRPVGIYRRASGLLRVMPSGGLVGAIEIYAPTDLPELLGHELEHVIEQLDGIDLAEQSREGLALRMDDGSFETERAVATGRRVSGEVADNAPDRMRSAGGQLWRAVRRRLAW